MSSNTGVLEDLIEVTSRATPSSTFYQEFDGDISIYFTHEFEVAGRRICLEDGTDDYDSIIQGKGNLELPSLIQAVVSEYADIEIGEERNSLKEYLLETYSKHKIPIIFNPNKDTVVDDLEKDPNPTGALYEFPRLGEVVELEEIEDKIPETESVVDSKIVLETESVPDIEVISKVEEIPEQLSDPVMEVPQTPETKLFLELTLEEKQELDAGIGHILELPDTSVSIIFKKLLNNNGESNIDFHLYKILEYVFKDSDEGE